MDAMILGTAKAYSQEGESIVIVTADRGFRAGMTAIGYPFETIGENLFDDSRITVYSH